MSVVKKPHTREEKIAAGILGVFILPPMFIAVFSLVGLALAPFLWMAWNWLAVPAFAAPSASFFQCFAAAILLLLVSLFFGKVRVDKS